MCRWLAYQGTPIYLDELIYQPAHSLIHQCLDAQKTVTRVNADGFGVGWYSERDMPGQFHETRPAWSDENLRSLSHHIRSHRFMGHVRSSTGSQVSRANCHPFIMDQWMFLHNGQIGQFNKVKYDLERRLPEDLYLSKRGTTDSELVFLLMIKNGLFESPVEAIQRTIDEVERQCQLKQIAEPFKASMCVSNGGAFWVVRYSSDGVPPTVFLRSEQGNITLASEPLDGNDNWFMVKPQTITLIEGACCHIHELR